jgi:hypothetical protein
MYCRRLYRRGFCGYSVDPANVCEVAEPWAAKHLPPTETEQVRPDRMRRIIEAVPL